MLKKKLIISLSVIIFVLLPLCLKLTNFSQALYEIDFAQSRIEGLYYRLAGWEEGDSHSRNFALFLPKAMFYKLSFKILAEDSALDRLEIIINHKKRFNLTLDKIKQAGEYNLIVPQRFTQAGYNRVSLITKSIEPSAISFERMEVTALWSNLDIAISSLVLVLIITFIWAVQDKIKLRFKKKIPLLNYLNYYHKLNPDTLGSFFIYGFMILLLFGFIFLKFRFPLAANRAADYAFLLLCTGIILKIPARYAS